MKTPNSNTIEQRMHNATRSLMIWTLLWTSSLAVVAFAPKFIWDFAPIYTLIAIGVNVFFGFKMIMANKKHLDALDELQRRIQLNAMGISLGVSMVFGALYGLLEAVKLISFSPNPSNILFVMGITYIISIVIGTRRYA
jgi:hypothetical protein